MGEMIEAITDVMSDLLACAGDLEEIGREAEGAALRDVVGDLENWLNNFR